MPHDTDIERAINALSATLAEGYVPPEAPKPGLVKRLLGRG